jgi:hypothetical protein
MAGQCATGPNDPGAFTRRSTHWREAADLKELTDARDPALALAAAPSAAQFAPTRINTIDPARPFGLDGPSNPSPGRDLRDVRQRIDQGRDAGQLSRREARQLRRQADVIGAAGGRFAQDGLSASERRELAIRTQVLRDQVTATRSGVEPGATGGR